MDVVSSHLTPALSPSGEGGRSPASQKFPVEQSGHRPDAIAPFTIPAEERLALPVKVREEATLKLSMLARIHRAKNKSAETARQAASMRGEPGFSKKTLERIYQSYVKCWDWRVCANKAKAPELRGGELVLSVLRRREFLDWAHGFLLLNQREKFRPRYRKLMERLELWRRTSRKEYAIPGYDAAPANAPGQNHPAGWSPSQLGRLCNGSKFEKRAMGVGRSAAAEFRPLVLTTRALMKIGQVFFFDDNEHDMKVRHLGSQGRVLRPLEFSCLDHFSGCFVANVFKPTLYDEETEKKVKLRAVEFLWLAVHWLLDIGWRADTGTQLVAEHGTAKFPQWFQDRITELTKGKVTFEEGAVDRRAACEGFLKGPARGNFRTKSPLESMFNLVRNETSDLLMFPGQVGLARERSPEELPARESHEKQLALAELVLSRDGVERLRHDFLEWNQWKQMAFEVYAKINRRGGPGLEWWEHELEGYVEAGLIASEWRLPCSVRPMAGGESSHRLDATYTDWMPASALEALNGEAAAIRELLHADPVNLTRNRKLCPWEVWQRSAAELTRAPLWWLPLLLPPEMGRPVEVADDHTIEFQDQTISTDKLRFLARMTSGHRPDATTEEILRPGSRYLGFVNQFNPQAIYLCDASGRGLGQCPRWARVDRCDQEAVAAQSREARRMEAALLAPVAKAGAELARVRADNAAWNAEQLQRHGSAPATGPEKRIRKEEQAMADLADDLIGGKTSGGGFNDAAREREEQALADLAEDLLTNKTEEP